jgi:hypothetical protein
MVLREQPTGQNVRLPGALSKQAQQGVRQKLKSEVTHKSEGGFRATQSRPGTGHNQVRQQATPNLESGSLRAAGRPETAESANRDEAEKAGLDLHDIPFILSLVANEHERQVDELLEENVQLKEKLNSVLTSTWGFKEDGWHGGAQTKAGFAALDLVISGTKGPAAHTIEPDDIEKLWAKKAMTSSGQATFRPRLAWSKQEKQKRQSRVGYKSEESTNSAMRRSMRPDPRSVTKEEVFSGEKFLGIFPIQSPTSTHRLYWDIAGMCMLAYDFIMVPLSFFITGESFFLTFLEWATLVFWTFDVLASLLTGIVKEGEIVMEPSKITRNYLKTWAILDAVVLGPDWITLFAGGGGATNLTSLLRAIRIIRIVRLLRLAKLRKLIMRLKDRITSETVFFAWGVTQQIVFLILVSHVIGSLWYYIGDVCASNGMRNWIEEFDMQDESFTHQYTSSFHWSLGHFSPGTNLLSPMNWVERLYAIFVTILGMVLVFLVSASIVTNLIRLMNAGGETEQSFWLLRRYMRQHELPAPLVTRILRFLEYKIAEMKKLCQRAGFQESSRCFPRTSPTRSNSKSTSQ